MNLHQTLLHIQTMGLERLDAQLLLLHVLGKSSSERSWLLAHNDEPTPSTALKQLLHLAQRRAAGEPLAYLTGHKEFFGLTFQVDARVLIPRPDTETLVNWVLDTLHPGGRFLDLGTGSGAIALSIKHARPDSAIHATDYSADALTVAQNNAQRLGLTIDFTQGAWLDAVSGCFDVIASNPPYIATTDPHLANLTHEPRLALTSGPEGMDALHRIIDSAPDHLKSGGWLLLEHGWDQATAVQTRLQERGFSAVQGRLDLAGITRCSGGQWGSHDTIRR